MKKESKKQKPTFRELLTTNIEEVHILFEEGATYSVPKTTAGE